MIFQALIDQHHCHPPADCQADNACSRVQTALAKLEECVWDVGEGQGTG